eukprot:4721135-Pyramimonas_sp.AAC.1
MALLEKIRAVKADIVAIIESVDNSDDETKAKQMISKADKVMTILMQQGLAYRERIQPDKVGVDPENRFGQGLDPMDVHALGLEILSDGFSEKMTSNATCFEVDPNSTRQYDFNKELSDSSDGMIPYIAAHDLRATTVTCSHTTGFIRAVFHGASSELDEKYTTDGKLSKDKIIAADPGFKDVLERGLMYYVARHQVANEIPLVANFLSEAGNAAHGIERTQTKIQTLLQIHTRAVRARKMTGSYNLDGIARSIEQGKPYLKGQ